MSINSESELQGMQEVSNAVAITLKKMREYAQPGMTTKELDDYGRKILATFGARSAPELAYNFPGATCISINHEIAHGIPSQYKKLQTGDLINIDVSAELHGFWSDNGGSFVVGDDIHQRNHLVQSSKDILKKALASIKGGLKIADLGKIIETQARQKGYTVIKNLTGHGIGRKLHEAPHEIANYHDRFNTVRFKKNSVVAIETFISTQSTLADTLSDGWTLIGNKGGYVAQHEHTIIITDAEPVVLTLANEIFE